MHGRCTGDAREMHGRCTGGLIVEPSSRALVLVEPTSATLDDPRATLDYEALLRGATNRTVLRDAVECGGR